MTMTISEVRTLVRQAARANATAAKKTGEARILSARATHAAVESGALGGKSPVWKTAGDYASDLGVTPATITGLKRLGRALHLGIDPAGEDSERWGFLSSKAGTKEVGALLTAEDATADSIRAGVDRLLSDQRSGKSADKREARPADGTGAEGDATATVHVTPVEAVRAALEVLRKNLPNLSAEEWAATESAMGDLITREVTVRTAEAKKSRKSA